MDDQGGFAPVVTVGGIAAALAANTGGFSVDITHVALGDSGYAVAVNALGQATQSALLSEQVRVEIQDATETAPGQTDISFVVDGPAEFYVREVGFFMADGTLFAVASSTDLALAWKASNVRLGIGLEVFLDQVNPDDVTIVSSGPALTLLMTREIATLSSFSMHLALEQLRQRDAIQRLEIHHA